MCTFQKVLQVIKAEQERRMRQDAVVRDKTRVAERAQQKG